jgi:putative protease
MELVCPAGSLPALRAAVDNGADCVYIGFREDTNARNFAGLNFDTETAREGLRYAHDKKRKVFLTLNTYPQLNGWNRAQRAVDRAAELEFDAVIIADPGVMQYAVSTYPQMRLHLSVQGSATSYEAINFYHQHFDIKRAVLPRVLSLAQIKQVVENTSVEIEVFGFGSLCVMAEGRCALSSYATGESPNTCGVCSPAKAVRWVHKPDGLESRLNGILIDHYSPNESTSYPTLCKGRFDVQGETYYAIEEPTSLNTMELIPDLEAAGIVAIKIEGRQRSPAYVARVTRTWRKALDTYRTNPRGYEVQPDWTDTLRKMSEGQHQTFGAYHRSWK